MRYTFTAALSLYRRVRPTLFRWTSRCLFIVSILLFLLCILRLLSRFFPFLPLAGIFSDEQGIKSYKSYRYISDWCALYALKSATSAVFAALGIVNFSYSHVVTARDKSLYGIHLSDVMRAQFPWHGKAYILYSFWIILGLYCSEMSYPVMAATCLAGALCTFFSTGIVAYLFVSNHRLEQDMVEHYLTHFKLSKKIIRSPSSSDALWESAFAYMGNASTYIRGYYQATQAIPKKVAQTMWTKLRFGLSACELPTVDIAWSRPERFWSWLSDVMSGPDSNPAGAECGPSSSEDTVHIQLADVQQTAHLIIQMESIWQRLLRDLPPDKQADLIRKLFLSIAEGLSILTDQQSSPFSGSPPDANIPEPYRQFGLPLCGLISFLRKQTTQKKADQPSLEDWSTCIGQVYLASGLCPGERMGLEKPQACDSLFQMLFLLVEAAVIGEAAAATLENIEAADKFWRELFGLEETLNASRFWVPQFLTWGRSITLSYASEWYGVAGTSLEHYNTCHWIWDILSNNTLSS